MDAQKTPIAAAMEELANAQKNIDHYKMPPDLMDRIFQVMLDLPARNSYEILDAMRRCQPVTRGQLADFKTQDPLPPDPDPPPEDPPEPPLPPEKE